MTEDRMLQEAIKAIDNGQLARARDLLTRLLRQDQSNTDYWLYMSAVVETEKERTFCLENVLKYDPESKTAVQGLVMLGAMDPSETTPRIRPVNERTWEVAKILGIEEEEGGPKARSRLKPVQVASLAVFGVLSIGLIFFGIFGNPFYTGPDTIAVYNTPRPVFTAGPTPTYLPTNTPEGGIANNISGPTPLVFQLDATYTPTPRYIDTPHPVISAYDSGMRSLDAENYEQAIVFLEQAADAEPGAIDILYYLGQAYLWSEDYENARRYFEIIIDEDDAFAPAYVGRAQALLGMDPEREVTADLYKAVSIDDEYIDARLAWADYKLFRDKNGAALEDIQIALEIDPENAQAYTYLARVYIELDKPEEALEAAQTAFDLDLTNPDNYRLLAQTMLMNGNAVDAITLLGTYISHSPEDYFGWYLLGRANQGAGNTETALEIFEFTYEHEKKIYEMSHYWALAMIDAGEYEGALDRLLVPLQRFPRWYEPYVAQAQAYYLNEEYDRAKEALEAGADRAISDEQKAALYYWRGVIYSELGYPGIAEDAWADLLALPLQVVPAEWWSEAQANIGEAVSPSTTQEATPTRVPTATPVE
jgi:tetratricopeptide (TPR) repeat protein